MSLTRKSKILTKRYSMNTMQFNAGYRDAKAGCYDKWYRYNASDNGASYEAGVQVAKSEGAVINNIIECIH